MPPEPDQPTLDKEQPEPKGFSFYLGATLERCCQNPEHRLMSIRGRDKASQAFISNWLYWCPDCQALSMTLAAATYALEHPDPNGGIGFVVQAPLHMRVERGKGQGA